MPTSNLRARIASLLTRTASRIAGAGASSNGQSPSHAWAQQPEDFFVHWEHPEKRDRPATAKQIILNDALTSWRKSPITKRIVKLTRDHVWGRGWRPYSPLRVVQRFLDDIWAGSHMDRRVPQWIDALTMDGEVFPTIHTDPATGLSLFRAIPAAQIVDFRWAAEDYESLTAIAQRLAGSVEPQWWPYLDAADRPDQPAIYHIHINRLVGAVRGEGDLAAVTRWIEHYDEWLDARARRNQALADYYYEVIVHNAADVADAVRRYSRPPSSGAVVVHSAGEEHRVIQPHIGADDSEADGYALRLMIAAGAGIPIHWLAEPGEGNSEATSRTMNETAYRNYTERQADIRAHVQHLLEIAYWRAAALGKIRRYSSPEIQLLTGEIATSDNTRQAQAARDLTAAFSTMRSANLDTDPRIVRLIYRAVGEDLLPEEIRAITEEAKQRSQSAPQETQP